MTNTQNSPALSTNVVFCLWTDSGEDGHTPELQGIFFTRKGAEDFLEDLRKNYDPNSGGPMVDRAACEKYRYDQPSITEEIVSP